MFSTEELESLDRSYFSVICADAYDVTIMSKNTGHVWYIHNPEYPEPGNCIIFHKHRASHPYHRHGRAGSLRQAVRSIQGHDAFQMNGRKPWGESNILERQHFESAAALRILLIFCRSI